MQEELLVSDLCPLVAAAGACRAVRNRVTACGAGRRREDMRRKYEESLRNWLCGCNPFPSSVCGGWVFSSDAGFASDKGGGGMACSASDL